MQVFQDFYSNLYKADGATLTAQASEFLHDIPLPKLTHQPGETHFGTGSLGGDQKS